MGPRVALAAIVVLLATPLAAQYTPPVCTGTQLFSDVPNANPFCAWIRQAWRQDLVSSCDGDTRFCPDSPITRAQAAELLGKTLHQHLWGQGRPNGRVYGHQVGFFELLCTGTGGVSFGLSRAITTWEGAAAACPAGYWVCTYGERGTGDCYTARPTTTCDIMNCAGTCSTGWDDMPGWVTDDGSDNIFPQAAGGEVTAYESGGLPAWPPHCESYPVWCCTR